MRVAIFGAGAVGAYVGGRLAQTGAQVALLARGDHLQALTRHCGRDPDRRRGCRRSRGKNVATPGSGACPPGVGGTGHVCGAPAKWGRGIGATR